MTFRLNLMNIIATQSQRYSRRLWHQMNENIEKRIVRFVKDRCIYPAGQKQLRTKMTVLARELGCSRLEISEALHRLEEKQLFKDWLSLSGFEYNVIKKNYLWK